MLNSAKCALPEIPDEIERLPKLKHGSLATRPRWDWFLSRSRDFPARGEHESYGVQRQVAFTNVTNKNYERPRPRDRGTRAPPPLLVG